MIDYDNISDEEIKYWIKEYPELTAEEILDLLEAVALDEAAEAAEK